MPKFNRDTLPVALQGVGLDYFHLLPDLGGWRSPAFQGFFDFM